MHAFFFLGALLLVITESLAEVWAETGVGRVIDRGSSALFTAQSVYLPYYLYRSMRRVYGQSRGQTLFKLALLAVGYLLCLVLTSVGLLVMTALAM
ncbi:MAG: hypothetical protein ACKOZX_01730 [Gammaproteobacteria bacterium]